MLLSFEAIQCIATDSHDSYLVSMKITYFRTLLRTWIKQVINGSNKECIHVVIKV